MGDGLMVVAIDRFWGCVNKEVEAPCWIWTGPRYIQGYGRFCTGNWHFKAHRVSWEIHHEKAIPHGLVICHSCDNKLCVNPQHLRADTQASNVHEAVSRGRWKPNFGAMNGRTILTPEQIREIRGSIDTQVLVAAKYGISQTHVSRIRRGENWNHIS